jgi:hypothetical protein
MGSRREDAVVTGAALFVLFTAMLDARLSFGLAVGALVGLAVYGLLPRGKQPR